MIDAESFLKEQGLQPASTDAGDPVPFGMDAKGASDQLRSRWMDFGRSDEFAGSANTPKASRHARHAGRVANRGSERAMPDPNDLDSCREAALRLLDAAPRPSGALRERLVGKVYAIEVVDDVIDRLERVQLINDEAYAQSAVRYCASRLMGRRGAVMELIRKGVDRGLAQHVCDEAEAEGVFSEAAWELGRRTARKTTGMDCDVRKRRFWSAGGRKGHNPDILRQVAQELFD